MQVCVLGFDALEYSLAKEYKELRQADFYKVDNTIQVDNPSTPELWASIISGELPETHGAVKSFQKSSLQVPNLFDQIEDSVAIQVPCENITELPRGEMSDAMGKPGAMRRFYDKCMQQLKDRINRTIEAVKESHNLVFTHFYATDFIGHMYAWDKERMDTLYSCCAEATKEVGNILVDGAVLIVSDHGMIVRKDNDKLQGRVVIPDKPHARRGYHSDYAFLSSSLELGLTDPHITDIFSIVLDLTKMPEPKETEALKERLEDLGYLD